MSAFLHPPSFGAARFWVGWFGAGLALGLILSLIWWGLLEPAAADKNITTLTIPRGTADAVSRGQPAPFIPNALSLGRNRELRVLNEDVVDHKVGASTIAPGGVVVIKAPADSKGLACTVHPTGYVGLSISARPGFDTVLLQSSLVGMPFGLVAGIVVMVGRRLSMDEEPTEAPAPGHVTA